MKKLVINARIMTMEDVDYENGYLLIENDKIAALGDMRELPQIDAETATEDAKGLTLLPGFVDAHCHVGMWEEGLGFEGDDGNEDTEPVMPQLRAIDAVNPFDEAFYNARMAGVTTVVTGPGSANVFGGQFAALKTDGNCVDRMIVKAPAAQKIALGENPKLTYSEKKQMPATRMATAALVRETLLKAKEYRRDWEEYHADEEDNDRPALDFRMESLLPVLRGEIPLKIHCHRADDICTAIRIGEEFQVPVTLEHCTEGHLIAGILAEKKLPLMLGPTFGSKSKPELRNLSFDIYRRLEELGLEYAIITDHPEIPIQELYLCAVLAVRHGADKKAALRAITINAAKNTGIDDRVGSLRIGKDADFLLMSGEVMTLSGKVESVTIGGRKIF